MENVFSPDVGQTQNFEDKRRSTHNGKVPYFPKGRPESTEIRIDPGGHTSTNFHKSNDSPFFLPDIKNSNETYDQKFMVPNTGNLSFQRVGQAAPQVWTNHIQSRKHTGRLRLY